MWGVILRIKFYFKNHITKYNVPKCNITNLSNYLSQPSIFNDKSNNKLHYNHKNYNNNNKKLYFL